MFFLHYMGIGESQLRLLLMLLSISGSMSDFKSSCGECECKWSGGKKMANCTGLGFTAVPTHLHKDIQVLILDNNIITSLTSDIFVTNTPNLQKIFLRHCQIEKIHQNTFRDLKILIEVDLSHNNLTGLESKTFAGNGRLKKINLSFNDLKNVTEYQFPPLPHLRTLDFSNCRISHIDHKALRNLGNSVETISLRGNKLNILREEVFMYLTNLKSLELHHNPWNCDCQLKSFRDWVVDRGLYNYPTTCREPERLAGRMWDHIPSLEFACKPEIVVSQGRVYSQPGSNVTLSCKITGNPTPEVKWVQQGRIVTNSSAQTDPERSRVFLIHQIGELERWYNLTLVNVSEEDADDFTCVAVNAGGVSEQNVSLTFNQPVTLPSDSQEPMEDSPSRALIVGAVTTGSILSVVILLVVGYCCRSKCRSKTRRENYNSSILGFSETDHQNLLEPRGILKQRDNSYSSGPDLELDSYGLSMETSRTSPASPDKDHGHFPDLLDIPIREKLRRDDMMEMQCQCSSPQTLTASPLVKEPCQLTPLYLPFTHTNTMDSCKDPNCGISTAAILPPPPSFLGSSGPVQTVPLHQQSSSYSSLSAQVSGYCTMPRTPRQTWSRSGSMSMILEAPPLNSDAVPPLQLPNYDGAGVRTSVDGSSKGPPIKQQMETTRETSDEVCTCNKFSESYQKPVKKTRHFTSSMIDPNMMDLSVMSSSMRRFNKMEDVPPASLMPCIGNIPEMGCSESFGTSSSTLTRRNKNLENLKNRGSQV